MDLLTRSISFILIKDNFLKFIINYLNIINFYFFIDSKVCILNTIILFLIYFFVSNQSLLYKIKIILIWITFSCFTIFGEAFIIHKTKGEQIKYNKADMYNVSSWLFTAYASMILAVILLNDYFNYMFKINC